MKIAFLVSTFYPRVGGMGKVVLQEAQGLVSAGHVVEVFTLDYGDNVDNLEFSVKRFKTFLKFGDAGIIFSLFRYFKDFDLVHLHYPFFGSDWTVVLSKLLWKKPYILTYHMDAKPNNWLKKISQKIYNLFFKKLLFKYASAVILVDQDTGQFASAYLIPAGKRYVLPNPIDTNIFNKFTDVQDKTILFVGNFLAVKRVDLIFEALRQLPDLSLVLVGGGYEEEKLKFLAKKLSIADKIKWFGYAKNDQELACLYSMASCTIVASDYESYSLVAAESMACATPVIASSANGAAQRVVPGVDGFIFKKNSAADLVTTLSNFFALAPSVREQMGESGREKILRTNGLNTHISELLKIYYQVL